MSNNSSENNQKNGNSINKGSVIRKIILILAIGVFCYSSYQLINIYLEYKKGKDIYNSIDNQVLDSNTPENIIIKDDNGNTSDVEISFTYNHDSLLSINPDGLGYLYIPSINLRLPIVQTTDNDYYLTHAFEGTYNGNGCIFEDYRIDDKLNSTNVILYGHNMKNGSMFGLLPDYDKTGKRIYTSTVMPIRGAWLEYETDGNDIFYIYTEDKIMMYKIFSAYVSEPISDTYTFNFSSIDGLREYAATMKSNSNYETNVDVSQTTQVVTLSTCTSDGSQRFIVHGTYIGQTSLNTNIN